MATKKKNFWYVLVCTANGPKFVTSVSYIDKTAMWESDKKPLEMDRSGAQDLTLGLNLNLHMAFAVCQPFELDRQPYRYDIGQFEWQYNEKGEEEDESNMEDDN